MDAVSKTANQNRYDRQENEAYAKRLQADERLLFVAQAQNEAELQSIAEGKAQLEQAQQEFADQQREAKIAEGKTYEIFEARDKSVEDRKAALLDNIKKHQQQLEALGHEVHTI